MYYLQVFAILLLLSLSSGTRSLDKTCDQFQEKIQSCEPYACITADPKHEGHVINWSIMGKESGLCSWSHKRLKNEEKQIYELVKCQATTEDQALLAKDFSTLLEDPQHFAKKLSGSCQQSEHKAQFMEESKEITSLDFLG